MAPTQALLKGCFLLWNGSWNQCNYWKSISESLHTSQLLMNDPLNQTVSKVWCFCLALTFTWDIQWSIWSLLVSPHHHVSRGAVSPTPVQRPVLCKGLTRRTMGWRVPLRMSNAGLPASWQSKYRVCALHPQFLRKLSFQSRQVCRENKSYSWTVSKMHLCWNFLFWNNSAFTRVAKIAQTVLIDLSLQS